jgi:hypothetical protein
MEFFNYPLYLMVRHKRTERNLNVIRPDKCVTDHPDIGKTVIDQINEKRGIIESVHITWQHLEGYCFSAVIRFTNNERIRILWQPRGIFLSANFRHEIYQARQKYKIVK